MGPMQTSGTTRKKEMHLTPVTLPLKNAITGPAGIFQYDGQNPIETTAL